MRSAACANAPVRGLGEVTDVLEVEREFDAQLGPAAQRLFYAWVTASDDLAHAYVFAQIRRPTLRSVRGHGAGGATARHLTRRTALQCAWSCLRP